jgi:hypothetical protein
MGSRITVLATCALLLLLAACVDGTSASGPRDGAVDVPYGLVASVIVEVDPSADVPIRILEESRKGVPTSVLGRLELVGPGSWNPNTERLSAIVRITNRSSGQLDEPRMEIVSLNRAEVQAELIHGGGGGVGSLWRFADLDHAQGSNAGSARQRIRFHAPGALSFTFRVDVIADPDPESPVDPDDDDDMHNEEIDEPAGDDCDDGDSSVRPGRNGCHCLGECNACSDSQCCRQACQGVCECPSTCSCEYDAEPGAPDVRCNDASCELACDSHVGECSIGECVGSDCGLSCERSAALCTVDTCSDSSCAVECASSLALCRLNDCVDGAACSLSCSSAAAYCRVDACEGSTCDVSCDRMFGPCGVATCSDSDCHVTCSSALSVCAIDRCESGSCTVECTSSSGCRMSCAEDAECRMRCSNTGSCNLTCDDGPAIVCGNGWRVCPGTPCP